MHLLGNKSRGKGDFCLIDGVLVFENLPAVLQPGLNFIKHKPSRKWGNTHVLVFYV